MKVGVKGCCYKYLANSIAIESCGAIGQNKVGTAVLREVLA